MPILPLDHPEPFAAVLGVMLYPGENEPDRQRARAFASQFLAEPIRRFHKAGVVLPYNDLARIAADAGVALEDLKRRWWEGTATGELFKTLFALFNTDPALASWKKCHASRRTDRYETPSEKLTLLTHRNPPSLPRGRAPMGRVVHP